MSRYYPPPAQISVRVNGHPLSDMSDAEIKGKKRRQGTVRMPLSPTDEIVAKRKEQKTYNLDGRNGRGGRL